MTLVAWNREMFFAEDAAKAIAEDCWLAIPQHFPAATLDGWVVMPNHIHGIVVIDAAGRGVQLNAPTLTEQQGRLSRDNNPFSAMSPNTHTLGTLVRTYKAAVTTRCRRSGFDEFRWQRNYYERVIRDDAELNRAREYILNNPLQWDQDQENPSARGVRSEAPEQHTLAPGPQWEHLLQRIPALQALSEEAHEQILSRWLNKYLRAVMQAKSQEWEDRAWLALYSYLTYPFSARKPFSLAPSEADTVIASFQEEVQQLKARG